MFATSIVQPLDLVKNRLQLAGESGQARASAFETIKRIAATEGPFSFYNGYCSFLRTFSY